MTSETNNNEITSLGEFILRVQDWHAQRVANLQHFLDIPDTGDIEIEFEGKTLKLEGDALLAFRAGISSSLDALGQLPFKGIEDSSADDIDAPTPEILGVEDDGA